MIPTIPTIPASSAPPARAFDLAEAIELLRRTPRVLETWLTGLPDGWTRQNEGPGTWSPYDVVGHLVHGEKTDWLPRARHLLRHGTSVPFEPFDREAMFRDSAGKSLADLLADFARRRQESLEGLAALSLSDPDLDREGLHPELGRVTLRQHLATWVAHDLTHLGQVARVMAKLHRDAVGPWRVYLPLLDR
jgi:hypothetical protein